MPPGPWPRIGCECAPGLCVTTAQSGMKKSPRRTKALACGEATVSLVFPELLQEHRLRDAYGLGHHGSCRSPGCTEGTLVHVRIRHRYVHLGSMRGHGQHGWGASSDPYEDRADHHIDSSNSVGSAEALPTGRASSGTSRSTDCGTANDVQLPDSAQDLQRESSGPYPCCTSCVPQGRPS